MAMTKEELLEMIDSTIYENENKAITGGALNAALTAIVEAMGTGSGGGSGSGGSEYTLPRSIFESSASSPYIFTDEEAAAFRAAVANPSTRYYLYYSMSLAGVNVFLSMPMSVQTPFSGGSYCFYAAIANIDGTNLSTQDMAINVIDSGTEIQGIMV